MSPRVVAVALVLFLGLAFVSAARCPRDELVAIAKKLAGDYKPDGFEIVTQVLCEDNEPNLHITIKQRNPALPIKPVMDYITDYVKRIGVADRATLAVETVSEPENQSASASSSSVASVASSGSSTVVAPTSSSAVTPASSSSAAAAPVVAGSSSSLSPA